MVLLNSLQVPLGTPMPEFTLPAVTGEHFSSSSIDSRATVVMFICNHCPYVKAVEDRIIALAREFGPRGVQFVGICSNDPSGYPEDRQDKLLERWRAKGYGFPYLVDETQDVARTFQAVCTPDIFVYDGERQLAYRGRIDDSWQDPARVARRELADALERLVTGGRPAAEQFPSMGCSIKWRQS